MFIGSLAIAIPASAIGYFVFLWLWRKLGLHMPVRKSAPSEPGQDSQD